MRSLQRKINVSQKKQEKKINVDNRYRYDIQKGTFTQQYVQLSVFIIKTDYQIKYKTYSINNTNPYNGSGKLNHERWNFKQ
jgi:hypothetical protein